MKRRKQLKRCVCLMTLLFFSIAWLSMIITLKNVQFAPLESAPGDKFNYAAKYPFYKTCKHTYVDLGSDDDDDFYDYSKPAPAQLHGVRFNRAILVYFPLELMLDYVHEVKWLYRSWLQMIKYEPSKWRTDLIVAVDYESNRKMFANEAFFLNQLNCSLVNRRRAEQDEPMCVLLDYRPIRNRVMDKPTFKYEYLLYDFDVFDGKSDDRLIELVSSTIRDYFYLDSIMIAFESYAYLKQAGYDFVMRTDTDVFVTPLFAQWLPRRCNDFNVGRGGYSTPFNQKRLERVARQFDFGWSPTLLNLGSTWYTTPHQLRLASYLTLFSMAYLANEEFALAERQGRLDDLLWPDWHYFVLSMYGGHLALNHLHSSAKINLVRLSLLMDQSTTDISPIHSVLHLHVHHFNQLFSKFDFKNGSYDVYFEQKFDTKFIPYYAMRMALDGKFVPPRQLRLVLEQEISKKN